MYSDLSPISPLSSVSGLVAQVTNTDLSQLAVDVHAMHDASREALGFASGQAATYAGPEEKHIHRLVASALELQSQKIEAKLKHIKALSQAIHLENVSLDDAQVKLGGELHQLRQQSATVQVPKA